MTTDTDFQPPYAFFTDATGLRIDASTLPGYPLPTGTGAFVSVETYQGLLNQEAPVPPNPLVEPPLDGRIYFVGTIVHDEVEGTDTFNPRTSTLSIYEDDLRTLNPGACEGVVNTDFCPAASFTQNRFNFATARGFLIPKAIGYSVSLINYFFRGDLGVCYGGSDLETVVKNQGSEPIHGTFALYETTAAGDSFPRGEWTTDERLPPNPANPGVLFPGQLMTLPAFSPANPDDALLLVFHGDMGAEGLSTTFAEAVVATPIDSSKLCTRRLWQWDTAGSALMSYDLGLNGLPNGSAAAITPTPSLAAAGVGIAYDPTDRNLWFTTTASDGILRKMTQSGQVIDEREVVGTLLHEDGPFVGLPQVDFSALAMDPADPHFIWVSGATSYLLDFVPIYKVHLDATSATVVQTCTVRRGDAPVFSSAGNHLLAAGLAPFYGPIFAVAPNLDWQGNRLFAYQGNCVPFAIWDLLPPPPGELFHFPTGIEINGRAELLASVVEPNDARVFYNFGFVRPMLANFTAPVATAPGEFDGDIAIGSDF